jgi:hypothetical protein
MQPAFLLTTVSAALALALASTGMGAESAEELIQKGDVCYDKLQAAEALKFYLPAEKLDPNNVRLLVRSRGYRHLMVMPEGQGETAARPLAVDYAQRAAALAPKIERNSPWRSATGIAAVGNRQQIAKTRLIEIAWKVITRQQRPVMACLGPLVSGARRCSP